MVHFTPASLNSRADTNVLTNMMPKSPSSLCTFFKIWKKVENFLFLKGEKL